MTVPPAASSPSLPHGLPQPTSQGRIRRPGGRRLGYVEYGRPEGEPVFYFHGFPACHLEAALAAETATRLGVRLIAADRPGIGLSDPAPGRTLTDWPGDVSALADALGIGHFAVLGVSGGAPYAAACAALLPDRLTRAGIVSGLGPLDHPGATIGMPPLNRLVLCLYRHAPPLGYLCFALLAAVAGRRPERTFALLAGFLPPADRASLQGAPRQILIASYAEALRRGPAAGHRELWLFTHPWAIPLHRIALPVTLWHGEADTTVPAALGRHLAAAIPGCRSRFHPQEGHFSLPIRRMEEILATLADRGGERRLPIFVYGTLRPGQKNYPHYLGGHTVREEPALVAGADLYYLEDGGYPYLVRGEGEVHGTLLEIAPAAYRSILCSLDALEEYDPADEVGSVYLRRRATVRREDGSEVEAWAYYWNRPRQGTKIVSGNFGQLKRSD